MNKKKFHYVYKITNKTNNQIYVGVRSCDTMPELDTKYIGSGSRITYAIRKYGVSNFDKEILQTFESRELANIKEAEIVDLNFVLRPDTYNIRLGGHNGPLSEDTKRMISKSRMGTPAWNKGIPRTEKEKELMSVNRIGIAAWNKGIPRTSEEKLKMSKSHTGKTSPFKGKSHSPESLAKLSNKIVTQEMKSKMSKACKNQTRHTCPHCNILTTAGNYKRWHGDNCKFILL